MSQLNVQTFRIPQWRFAVALVLVASACSETDGTSAQSNSSGPMPTAAATATTVEMSPSTWVEVLTSIPYCPTEREDVYWKPGDLVPEPDWAQDELDAAHDRLIARFEASGDSNMTGVSRYGRGVVENRVQIFLRDVSQAATFAEQIGLEPPYEIYCITPEDVGSENADG